MSRPPTAPPSLARLALAATGVHLAFDTAGRLFTATTPPYLLLPFMSELFRDMLDLLGVNAISAVTCAINGLIAAVFSTALLEAGSRRLKIALLLCLVWLLTAGSMFTLYLSAPWPVALGSLAFGLPRAAALAWLLDRMMGRSLPQGP
jgi:apolipoprotein N-acyltransferase